MKAIRFKDEICKGCVTRGGGSAEERIMFSGMFPIRRCGLSGGHSFIFPEDAIDLECS